MLAIPLRWTGAQAMLLLATSGLGVCRRGWMTYNPMLRRSQSILPQRTAPLAWVLARASVLRRRTRARALVMRRLRGRTISLPRCKRWLSPTCIQPLTSCRLTHGAHRGLPHPASWSANWHQLRESRFVIHVGGSASRVHVRARPAWSRAIINIALPPPNQRPAHLCFFSDRSLLHHVRL
jgi:hypothetical protein